MLFFPYFVCALLGVDFVPRGFAKGNKISVGQFHIRPNTTEYIKPSG